MRHLSEAARRRIRGEWVPDWVKKPHEYRACTQNGSLPGRINIGLADLNDLDATALINGGRTTPPSCPECAVHYDEALEASPYHNTPTVRGPGL